MLVVRVLALLLLLLPAAQAQPAAEGQALARPGCAFWLDGRQGPITWNGRCAGGFVQGRGVLTAIRHDGRPTRLEGMFENGRLHGQGVEESPGDVRYEGGWSRGAWTGQGRLEFSDGLRIICSNWQASRINGQCQTSSPRGPSYDGMMDMGAQHGQGEMRFANGGWYRGEWRDGKAHGQGTYFNPNHGTFSGWWVNGCLRTGGLGHRVYGAVRGAPAEGPDCPPR